MDRSALRDTSVLVIDDHRPMRQIHRSLLRAFGFGQVIEAASVDEALRTLQRDTPELVICDQRMPGASGLDFVRALRRMPNLQLATLPVIMVTAEVSRQRLFEARDAGVNELCTKPISLKVMWERLAAVANAQRGFVRSEGYVGPCRRRRSVAVATERRGATETLAL
jgi:CheY-like chemotaxis protein